MERGQRGGHCRRGIAMNQYPVGRQLLEDRRQAAKHRGRDVLQGLSVGHDVEIELGVDFERGENLVEHVPVLRADADKRLDAVARRQFGDDGRHLDGFGPGAEDG